MAQGNEINPVQKGNKITVDIGYNEGLHEVLTYQNGKQSIEKLKTKNQKEPGDEDDCNYLYNDIYVAYVQKQSCEELPEEVSGMATALAYYSISNDPRFDLEQFQAISVASCKKGYWIKYSEFRQKVCGGVFTNS